MRREAHALVTALAVTLALPGCSAGAGMGLPDGGISASDGGHGRPDLGAAADMSFDGDAAGPAALTPEGSRSAVAGADIVGAALDSCYDGLDNNADGHVDCQDPGCAILGSCCPASSTCCDAAAAVTLPPFESCSGTLVGCALPGVTLFGTGLPHADAMGLFPGGDRSNEGGLVLDAPLDRTRTTIVSATFALPSATDCAAPCIDSVALGLITATTLGATSTVRPVIAVVASASLQEVTLVSGDVVLASMPVDASLGGSLGVTLTLSAAGAVVAEVAGNTLQATVPVSAAALHLAVYGHNENRAGVLSSRVTTLTLAQQVCDAPSVWSTRNVVAIGAGSSTAPAVLDGPSVAYSPTDARLAFATSAGIFVAHRALAAGTPSSYALQSGYAVPDVPGANLSAPDLHFIDRAGVSTWRIYVADGSTHGLSMMEAPDAPTLAFGAVVPVLAPSGLPIGTTITALDGPSVAVTTHRRTDFVLAARAVYGDGHTAIVLLRSDDGVSGWLWLNGDEASSTVTVPNGLADVAHDEVTSPSLVYRDGAWDLYYSGRTLGRTAIGLMLSDDLLHWRAAPVPVVLAETGAPSDFDAFSVRDPGLSLVDGDEHRVELFYAGTDGVTTRIGRVERAATTIDATP